MTGLRHCSVFLLLSLSCICPVIAQTQPVDRTQIEKEINELYEQIKFKEKLFLAPSPEDQEIHVGYLNQSDKGLIRLLPREKYDGKLSVRGGGAYYSFTRLTHEYGYGSDIELSQDRFSVGFAGYDFGFLIDLGKLPLEEVTLEHPGLKFPLNFTPPLTEPEIRAQQRQCGNGLQTGEFSYRSYLAVTVGHTYALRSVSYDRSDALVALQVVRQDGDGSVVLIWKMLKTFTAPKPERKSQS